jgi:hypothetical protein
MNTSELIMISDKEGKKLTGTLRWPGASEEDSTPGMSGQSITPAQVMIGEANPKGNNTAPNHQAATELLQATSFKRQRGQKL